VDGPANRQEDAHTSGASVCYPCDRSATRLMMHGSSEVFAISAAALGNGHACMEILLTARVYCSCAALCAVCCAGCDLLVLTRSQCAEIAAAANDGSRGASAARSMRNGWAGSTEQSCHLQEARGNEWLHRYKPTRLRCLPAASGNMPCPEWMRQQLGAHHGAFVHVRPRYKSAVAAKKQQAADNQPMEVEPTPIFPCQLFQLASAGMHAHRSIFAFEPKLTRSVALLGCTSFAQTATPALLAAAMTWRGAVFITCRVLLLRGVAASSSSPANLRPHAPPLNAFAPAAVSRPGCLVRLCNAIAATQLSPLRCIPHAPASRGVPKPQQSAHLARQYILARWQPGGCSAWRSSTIVNSALAAHLGCCRIADLCTSAIILFNRSRTSTTYSFCSF
jgi:hypothetical protein